MPTPIGNLKDITLRALEVLKSCDVIACEDTRVTKKLLSFFEITDKQIISHHEHNEKESAKGIISLVKDNKNVALVSDAGFPAVSDPGYRLVNEFIENNFEFEVLPGASSILPALVYSGFESNEFQFLGFVPQKKGRQTFIQKVLKADKTSIIFESVHRILKFLNQLIEFDPDRLIVICRELTKLHEEVIRGNAKTCLDHLENNVVKGEFVVVIKRKS